MYKIIFILIPIFFVFTCCENNNGVRSYKEKVSDQNINNKIQKKETSQDSVNLEWETPEGWTEKRGSGMRLATFIIRANGKETTCTIIPLKGDGGGLKPNILRWLNQLKIKMFPEEKLDQFISSQKTFKTSGNLSAILIDFTSVTPPDSDLSMLAAIVSLKNKTVFIKMVGEKSVLKENLSRFFFSV